VSSRPVRADIDRILADSRLIEAALRRAVRAALERHKRAGNPVATWKDGRVEWIAPEHLDLSEREA
jgi:hypothetical protein